ncbi:hypothetical protein GQ53DRAFT_420271 [Thozetella sp. PMI_491]|nr:hypothetical protein GQ53DRAFT_420271 [Thozetella sp. PMI_491]
MHACITGHKTTRAEESGATVPGRGAILLRLFWSRDTAPLSFRHIDFPSPTSPKSAARPLDHSKYVATQPIAISCSRRKIRRTPLIPCASCLPQDCLLLSVSQFLLFNVSASLASPCPIRTLSPLRDNKHAVRVITHTPNICAVRVRVGTVGHLYACYKPGSWVDARIHGGYFPLQYHFPSPKALPICYSVRASEGVSDRFG